MQDAKPRITPLGVQLKLSKAQAPKTKEEKDYMATVPYSSAVGSLMYAMVCSRPDIAHAVGVVSRYMANLGTAHWEAVKCVGFFAVLTKTRLGLRCGMTVEQKFLQPT